jgi:hypothetical protein
MPRKRGGNGQICLDSRLNSLEAVVLATKMYGTRFQVEFLFSGQLPECSSFKFWERFL